MLSSCLHASHLPFTTILSEHRGLARSVPTLCTVRVDRNCNSVWLQDIWVTSTKLQMQTQENWSELDVSILFSGPLQHHYTAWVKRGQGSSSCWRPAHMYPNTLLGWSKRRRGRQERKTEFCSWEPTCDTVWQTVCCF